MPVTALSLGVRWLRLTKAYWPVGLALGKLGVVRAPGRAERLVLDNSVAGTNSQCHVPENSVSRTSRMSRIASPSGKALPRQMGICIDVKQAHKRCRIKNSEQGLLGFTWQDELYFFRCCPFGAVFSQHWWGEGWRLRAPPPPYLDFLGTHGPPLCGRFHFQPGLQPYAPYRRHDMPFLAGDRDSSQLEKTSNFL